MMQQLELLPAHPHEHLFPYWRSRLSRWPSEVFMWRNRRNTTGWSMACQGFAFARHLFSSGQMSRAEFRRWWRLNRRVWRLEGVI